MGTARKTVGHDQAIFSIQGLVDRKEGEGVMMWDLPPVLFFLLPSRTAMELLWILLLVVAFCVSAVQSSPEDDIKENINVNMSHPLHIMEEGNLMVLAPPSLTQMLNQTRFLMVLFCECSPILGERMMCWVRPASLLLEGRGVLYIAKHMRTHIIIFNNNVYVTSFPISR